MNADRLELFCATTNAGKVAEIRSILGERVDLQPRPAGLGDVVEGAGSLVGNARLKAAAVARAAGRPAVADDSGLEVEVLDGAPGVETASFAGPDATDEDNWSKMLEVLAGEHNRRARFRTVAMVVWPDGREVHAEGTCGGVIAAEHRGTNGFGYDSVFVPDEGDGRSFGEMSTAEKDAISHRGKAFSALLELL